MNKEQIELKAERIALGTYLADYPDDWDYARVLECLFDNDEDELFENIATWEPFDNISPVDVARYIEDLKDHIVYQFTREEQQS
jgi:hypothetical protein